jgi:FixJ family two-component response regulator
VEARSSDDFLDLLVDASLPDGNPVHKYDVIITDLVMPGLSGLGVLKAFGEPLSSIPLVVISAIVDADLERRMDQVGAVGVLQKPFGSRQVRDALTSALSVVFHRSARQSALGIKI